jgi:hypothetical protein
MNGVTIVATGAIVQAFAWTFVANVRLNSINSKDQRLEEALSQLKELRS